MKRDLVSAASVFGAVLLISLSLDGGLAAERSEVSELESEPGRGQSSLDSEVAEPFYGDWGAPGPAYDGEEKRQRASPGIALQFEEEMLPTSKGVTTTFFKRFTGAFFQPRSWAASYLYFGKGCISATVNSYYVHEVQVPDGAVIDFIRFYYYDGVTADADMIVTTYDGEGGSNDVVSVSSVGSDGYGSHGVSLNLPVDSITESIMILYRPNTVSASMALCGARIRYQYNPLGVIFSDSFEAVT